MNSPAGSASGGTAGNTPARTATATPALERLQEEQHQITELLAKTAQHAGSAPSTGSADGADGAADQPGDKLRLVELIVTLLRVHDELQTRVLQPALAAQTGTDHPALARAAARRSEVRLAADRIEALPAGDDGGQAMAELRRQVQAWFDVEQAELFALAEELAQRPGGLDLDALDSALAARQEALLSAGTPP